MNVRDKAIAGDRSISMLLFLPGSVAAFLMAACFYYRIRLSLTYETPITYQVVCFAGFASAGWLFSELLLRAFVDPSIVFSDLSKLPYSGSDMGLPRKFNADKIREIQLLSSAIYLSTALALYGVTWLYCNARASFELEKFGVKEKVLIHEIRKARQGAGLGVFYFKADNKRFEKEILLNTHKLGDTLEIVYSANDPRILKVIR